MIRKRVIGGLFDGLKGYIMISRWIMQLSCGKSLLKVLETLMLSMVSLVLDNGALFYDLPMKKRGLQFLRMKKLLTFRCFYSQKQ